MKHIPKLKQGDRVYEVLIYTVREATVTGVSRIRGEDGRKRTFAYTIECSDGSLSPRYTDEDIGTLIFTDREGAAAVCRRNRRVAAPFGAKGAYRRRIEQRHGERELGKLYDAIAGKGDTGRCALCMNGRRRIRAVRGEI